MTDANRKDATPRHIWQVLRRLLNCNKTQLAARLGVHRHTLADWERATEAGEDPGRHAIAVASDLLKATLRSAGHSDLLAQTGMNWHEKPGRNR